MRERAPSLHWPQTIGALHAQARDAAWSENDCATLLKAHRAIEPLFVGWQRASGRCFTCHLVGTASLCLEFGGAVDETIAALTHAVFDEGAFGRSGGRLRVKARASLAAAAPAGAVALVEAYSRFSWPGFVEAFERDGPRALDGADERILRLRIVNELDDALDWPFFSQRARESGKRELAVAGALAQALGWEALAERCASVAEEMARIPPAESPARDAAYFVAPLGYRRSLRERLRRRVVRIAERIGNAIAARKSG